MARIGARSPHSVRRRPHLDALRSVRGRPTLEVARYNFLSVETRYQKTRERNVKHLSEEDQRRLPPTIDAAVLDELLGELPTEVHRQFIEVVIDPWHTLAPHAPGFAAGKLGSSDPKLADLIRRLRTGPDQSPDEWR